MPATVIDPEIKCRPLDLLRGRQAIVIQGGRALAAQSGSFLNRVKLFVCFFVLWRRYPSAGCAIRRPFPTRTITQA
jgi:hypothetical protein